MLGVYTHCHFCFLDRETLKVIPLSLIKPEEQKRLLNSSSSCRPWNILLADLGPLVSFIFLRQDLAVLPKLALDSWPQLIFLVSAS